MPQAKKGGGGCRVRGALRATAGQIELRPTEGGVFEGQVWGRAPIPLTVDVEGVFEVVLPPSSAVGRYRLRIGTATYTFAVPDAPTADLADLLKPGV